MADEPASGSAPIGNETAGNNAATSMGTGMTPLLPPSHFERLEGASNYLNWKFITKMILTLEGQWGVIEGSEVDEVKDKRAFARICISLKPTLLQYVRTCKSAKEAWDRLAQTFEDKGLFRRVSLLKQLHQIQFSNFSSMSEYIEKVSTIVQQLSNIGKVIEDEEVTEILLSGLPQEYDSLVSNLETLWMTKQLNRDIVQARLLQEEHRKNELNGGTALVSKSKSTFKKNKSSKTIICHYCQKKGHVQAKCYKKKADEGKKNNENGNLAAAFLVRGCKDWIIDSGCTSHMTWDRDCLINVNENNLKDYVTVANNLKLNCEAIGDTKLRYEENEVRLSNVLFVPELAANLLSVSRLVESGYDVKFDTRGCQILCKTSGKSIAKGYCKNGLYRLKGLTGGDKLHTDGGFSLQSLDSGCQGTQQGPVCASASAGQALWHKRLGHLNYKSMCVLKKSNIGVSFQDNGDTAAGCVPCLEGKLCGKPYPTGEGKQAKDLLELVHSDVCGPMETSSLGGARYMVTFIDDHSRKVFGYLIKEKSEVMSKFIDFKVMVEKQTGKVVKCLRSDNGGEYVSSRFDTYLRKEGILHQTSVPYCPQQNGVSERLNRTLIEKARCLLQGSGLGKEYWGEAVSTAIYLYNRSPSSALCGQIPEEVWTGRTVSLGHLRVFGCVAYALVPSVKRQKLDAKSKKYIFVGYSETSKGYRLMDPQNPKKVVIARNVEFLEESFYHSDINNYKLNFNELFYDPGVINVQSNGIDNCNNRKESVINSLGKNSDSDSSCDINYKENSNECSRISDEYCTGSEDESSCAEHEARASPHCSQSGSEGLAEADVSAGGPGAAGESSRRCAAGEGLPQRSAGEGLQPGLAGEGLQPGLVSEGSLCGPYVLRNRRNIVKPQKYSGYDLELNFLADNLVEPQSYDEAITSPSSAEWREAMQREYDSLIANNVFKLVDRPSNVNVVQCKWVFKLKYDSSGNFEKYKARLVARGFTQRYGLDYNDTFSPVVRHSSLRILFSLAVELNLEIDHVDVTTAFLNGNLNETIYMEQPTGFNNNDGKVCLLLKSIYGLKQASKMWNERVHCLLISNGFRQTQCEPCVYVKGTYKNIMIISLYVDDFYLFYHKGNLDKKNLMSLLESQFNVKDLGSIKNCLGMRVTRDRVKGTLKLDQSEYIKRLLHRFGMTECKPVKTPISLNCKLVKPEKATLDDNRYNYRQLIGSLMYLAVCTRPDIAFACSQLSQYNNGFDVTHWQAAKRILRYLAGTIDLGLLFVSNSNLNFTLSAFTDADWGNDVTDRKSYTGFIIKLGRNVINWESRKQRCVALSSTEAEYLAISDVCKDICFVRNLLLEIINKDVAPVLLYNDNQSSLRLLEVKEFCHKRTKHIDIRYHYMKDLIKDNIIKAKYLCTENMLADVLTKPLSSIKHEKFVKGMNMC